MNITPQTALRVKLETDNTSAGKYSKLRLVFVHAEDDGTMPWNQTEELFKSTLKAATKTSADDDACSARTPQHEAVDLGEAGIHEIWEAGDARIEKLVAKHGGKQTPARHKEPRCKRARDALRLFEIAFGDRRCPGDHPRAAGPAPCFSVSFHCARPALSPVSVGVEYFILAYKACR